MKACLTASVHCIVPHGEEQPRLPQVMSLWHSTAPCKNLTHFMLAVLCLRISVLNFTVQHKHAHCYQLPLVRPQRSSTYTHLPAAKYHHSSQSNCMACSGSARISPSTAYVWVVCSVVRTKAALGAHLVFLRRRGKSPCNSLGKSISADAGKRDATP